MTLVEKEKLKIEQEIAAKKAVVDKIANLTTQISPINNTGNNIIETVENFAKMQIKR